MRPLQVANESLEQKIAQRTSQLEHEIEEHIKVDNDLRASRQRLERLSRQLIATIENERRHLARELHDEIDQMLSAVRMSLHRTERDLDESLRPNLQSNLAMVDQSINQVPNLSLSPRPPQLDQL